MSKWKYRFYAEMSSGHNCDESEEVDLIEDYKCTEEELSKMSNKELNDLISGFWEQWFWEQCNGGFERINN